MPLFTLAREGAGEEGGACASPSLVLHPRVEECRSGVEQGQIRPFV